MTCKLTNTSHGRKVLFDRILSAELTICKYKINAFYEWKNKAQIFSLKFIDNSTVELGINLNPVIEDIFSESDKAMELTICYRSYFITTYLRCLESASDIVPNTLFQGLVVLEAIEYIHGGATVAAYSPLFDPIASGIKPIDVNCAIRSLSRMCIEQKGFLSQGVQAKCEDAINWMVSYTRLPEIEYNKPRKPEYALLRDLLCVKKLISANPSLPAQYSMFNQYGILSFDDHTGYDLISNDSLSEFWAGALIRALAFSENRDFVLDVTAFPCIRKGIIKFKEDSVVYFQECNTSKQMLLSNNLWAVKKIAMKIEQTFYDSGSVETGALHFMQ